MTRCMSTHQLFEVTLVNMENTLRVFEAEVPAPELKPYGHGNMAYRYVEQSLLQAIIQKLARMISGLRAAQLLVEKGLLQEACSIFRMLDEFREDVMFLCSGAGPGAATPLHKDYLRYFYLEEFENPDDALGSQQKRPMVPREKIQAHLSRIEGSGLDPHTSIKVFKLLSKGYSGFVHAASPQTMETYGGNPPHFHVRGMLDTPLMIGAVDDLRTHFYRGILSFGFAAHAFALQPQFESILRFRDHFEEKSGLDVTMPKLPARKRPQK